ncbi:MAG: hypothetical protein CMO81_04375 [Waddliaceae bacterium]|nr:hypothetical protein [Waddliaceae bacterium]
MVDFTLQAIEDTYAKRLYLGLAFPGEVPVILGRGISTEESFLIPRVKFNCLGEVFKLNRRSFKKHLKELGLPVDTTVSFQNYYELLQKKIEQVRIGHRHVLKLANTIFNRPLIDSLSERHREHMSDRLVSAMHAHNTEKAIKALNQGAYTDFLIYRGSFNTTREYFRMRESTLKYKKQEQYSVNTPLTLAILNNMHVLAEDLVKRKGTYCDNVYWREIKEGDPLSTHVSSSFVQFNEFAKGKKYSLVSSEKENKQNSEKIISNNSSKKE